jgi:hypothetical protein
MVAMRLKREAEERKAKEEAAMELKRRRMEAELQIM